MTVDIGFDPKKETREQLVKSRDETIRLLRDTWNKTQSLVWQNVWNLTPQQVFDELGTDAAQYLQLVMGLAQLINTSGVLENGVPIQVVGLMPSEVTMQPNADGTITVVSTIPPTPLVEESQP